MITLIAVTACQYDGRHYAPGSSFAVRSRNDAKVLTLLHKAKLPEPEPVEVTPQPVRRTYRRRNLTAEDAEA